jgi:2-dehydro-3-deoxygluconokinase
MQQSLDIRGSHSEPLSSQYGEEVVSVGPVVTVGEALASLEPVSGRLETASEFVIGALGAEFNYAIDLARLGIPARFFGALGADPLGRRILRAARAEGVDVSGVTFDDTRPTGMLLKDAPGVDGERPIHYLRKGSAASAFAPSRALRAAAESAVGVHVSGISFNVGKALRTSALELLRAGSSAPWRSFDVNVRLLLAPTGEWRAVIDEVLPLVNVLFATSDELGAIGLEVGATVALARSSATSCVIRCGRAKTLVVDEEGVEEHVVPFYAESVVDPVGTGDAFAAAVTAYRLTGAPWTEAVRAGHLAGAMVASIRGDYEGAPDAQELAGFMRGDHVNR